jgi:aminoglycoside 3-N-acetyltransferase
MMREPRNPVIEHIAEDCRALGVREGGLLLVHSSVRSLGLPTNLPERLEWIVCGLLAALGPRGTLFFPALSYETVRSHAPFFDVLRTPVCVGALPEYFRTRPGTIRSIHPTHSVCGTGPQAEALLKDHQRDTTPCGPNSLFARLPQRQGQILFLGCGLRPNTSMHAVEEHVIPPYLFGEPLEYTITLASGETQRMCVRRHNFHGWTQRYDRLEAVMPAGLRKGSVLQAEVYLLEAAQMWPAALRAYQENPLYFVDPQAAEEAS